MSALQLGRLLPLVVAAVVLGVNAAILQPWPAGVFYDDAMYLVLAKALATGEGYRYLNLPGTPAATHFPPGYPAVLAAIWALFPDFPDNLALLKLANCVFAAAAAVAVYVLARRRLALSPVLAAGVCALAGATFPFILLTGVLLSEPLFLALLVPALLVAERAAEEDDARLAAAVGAAAAVVALVRSVGILLIPAACLVLALRRRWRAAGACAAAGVLVALPWRLWAAAHAGDAPAALGAMYGPYASFVGDVWGGPGALRFVAETALKNLTAPPRLVAALFAVGMPTPVVLLVLGTAAACLATGAVRVARQAPVTAAYLAAYLATVLVWPFMPDRFLWAVWPLLAVTAAAGAVALWRAAAGRRWGVPARALLTAGLGAAAIGHLHYNARGFANAWYESPQRTAALAALPLARWVEAHVPPGDVVMSDAELLVYLYTGRRAIPPGTFRAESYLAPEDPAERAETLQRLVQVYEPRHILLMSATSPHGAGARRLLGGDRPSLTLVDTLPGGGAVLRPALPRP
ncbi:MAG TPA: glycosyltransferase family 39 protein [Gemmatimonadaceae bacterium]|nr:glycosyltransferase family 39 protein [Gemmatimonadaceae bacterium]